MDPNTSNNEEETEVDETMKLVVDDLVSGIEDENHDESWEKEKKIWEKRKSEREERMKEMRDLAQQESQLREELLKKEMEDHNLKEFKDKNIISGSLTASNLNHLETLRRGSAPPAAGALTEELESNIQARRYKLLDKIRINSVNLATYHNHRYHVYKNILFTIFRVPLILLAGLNSFFSVGLQTWVAQKWISLLTAIVSLFCGILTSVELLLNLQKRMEMEQETAKAYYRLSVAIYTELGKAIKDRGVKGDLRDFLKNSFNDYQNLYANANTVNMSERNFIDEFDLYIPEDNCDKENFNIETGTNMEGEYRNDTSEDDPETIRKKENEKLRISAAESAGICPECCRNLMISCLMTCFYCCTSSEKRIDRISKAERKLKHKERKNRMGITRSEKYNWTFIPEIHNI